MRGACLFAAVIAASTVPANAAVLVTSMTQGSIMFGFAIGVAAAVVGSIVVNTRNAALYGRKVLDDSEHSDFVEKPVTYRQPESLWGDVQRGGYHCADMRRDRVRRHPEAAATFPAGDVA